MRAVALPAAFVLVCGVLGFGVHRLHLRQQAAPAPVAAATAASEMLELPDGSSVEVEPSTQLRIDAAEPLRVRLTLLDGRSTLAVQSVEGRSFVVRAGHVDVNVLGGTISIAVKARARDRWDVEVHATEGRADIHRGSGALPLVLEPGETWVSKAL